MAQGYLLPGCLCNKADADYAAETANNAAATILENFGLAMLAQANTVPNQIMKLLQAGG